MWRGDLINDSLEIRFVKVLLLDLLGSVNDLVESSIKFLHVERMRGRYIQLAVFL